MIFVLAAAALGTGAGLGAALLSSSGGASGGGSSSGGGRSSSNSSRPDDDSDEAAPPNADRGSHKDGDPWGSFRAVDLSSWQTGSVVGKATEGILGFFGVDVDMTSDKPPAPSLFVDPEWATAALFYQKTVSGDTGAGVDINIFGGRTGTYKGVRGVYTGELADLRTDRGKELYGSNLKKAASDGAYIANVNGAQVLRYRRTWS